MEQNKPVLILEHCLNPIQKLNESARTEDGRYLLGGTFTEFNKMNRNNRIYTADKFIPHLEAMKQKKNTIGVLYGEFDHPDTFDIAAQRISHTIESVEYDKANESIVGTIKTMSTYWGKQAKAIIDDQCPLFVSSRAAGVTESNGHVALRQLFTYDIVADPGFASARMHQKSMNETLGINESMNCMVIDMSDAGSSNKLYEHNDNDFVTKTMLTEYSEHLRNQLVMLENKIKNIVASGKHDVNLDKTVEEMEHTNTMFESVKKHLDYLANHSTMITKTLNRLVENQDKMTQELNSVKQHNNHIVGKLRNSIKFTEHVASKLKTSIMFTDHVASKLNGAITEQKDITDKLDTSILFTEHIAKKLKTGIQFIEYVAEHTHDNIKFAEYIAEHTKGAIAFGDYQMGIAEENIQYMKYLAEKVDGVIEFDKMLVEKLNGHFSATKLNEDNEAVLSIESPTSFMGLDDEDEEEEEEGGEGFGAEGGTEFTGAEGGEEGGVEGEGEMVQPEGTTDTDVEAQPTADGEVTDVPPGMDGPEGMVDDIPAEGEGTEMAPEADVFGVDSLVKHSTAGTGTVIDISPEGYVTIRISGSEDTFGPQPRDEFEEISIEDDTMNLTESVKHFIAEAKKRKSAEVDKPAFFNFLSKQEIKNFKELELSIQENVKLHMENAEYFGSDDVRKEMAKALQPKLSLMELLMGNMPEDVKAVWETLNETEKTQVLAVAKLMPINNAESAASFWETRKFENVLNLREGKTNQPLVDSDPDKISEETIAFLENKFREFDR